MGDSDHGCAVQLTSLKQLCDAIMPIWTKISKECFHVESIL